MVKQRFQALDIMRGLTLALMILVNTPGSWDFVYAPLLHAEWSGFTPTDFIFPFFLFMVGAAMFFSQRSLMRPEVTAAVRHRKILKRTALLFLVGFFLNVFPFIDPLSHVRILGVLQRIALAYGLAAFLLLYTNTLMRWVISVGLLLGYWALLQLGTDPYSLEHSLVREVDMVVLGASHLWQGKGLPFDPEGLLSTLPSVVNVVLGFETVRILTSGSNSKAAQGRLLALGVVLVVVALVWNQWFPINKSLWTSPFVLLTSGGAILVLLVLIQLEKTAIKPALLQLLPFGKNPLFIYALSFVWEKLLYTFKLGDQTYYDFFYQQLCKLFDAYNASLAFALIHVILFWCVARYLDKKNIVISL